MIDLDQYLSTHSVPDKKSCLCFLIKNGQICLAQKKKAVGINKPNNYMKPNGYGGDIELGESMKRGTYREVWEETTDANKKLPGVELIHSQHVANLHCYFVDNNQKNRHVGVYLGLEWRNEPRESSEMATPIWYPFAEIPYDQMWKPDRYWLPRVLAGEFVNGIFLMEKSGLLLCGRINGQDIKC